MSVDKREQGAVDCLIEDGLATVTFFHPSHNSLPGKILAKLADTITELGGNDAVKLILLKSAGERTFCAGASFDELIAISNLDEGKKFFMGFANVINAMRKCPKLIIGRVQGKAVGGGVGVASATDFCVATKFASVKLSELAVGIGPFVVGPAVERKVGLSAMSQMAIDASTWQTAQWAKDKGLFTEIFESAEEMDAYLEGYLKKLLSYNPEAMSDLKKVIWQGTEHWDDLLAERAGISGKLVLSDFTKEFIKQFQTK